MYKVKEMRKLRNLTQEQLSELSGVSRAIISGLEAMNSNMTTTTETLIKIARALNCTVSDIFLP